MYVLLTALLSEHYHQSLESRAPVSRWKPYHYRVVSGRARGHSGRQGEPGTLVRLASGYTDRRKLRTSAVKRSAASTLH